MQLVVFISRKFLEVVDKEYSELQQVLLTFTKILQLGRLYVQQNKILILQTDLVSCYFHYINKK